MLNLAPYRYRKALDPKRGPIGKINCGRVSISGKALFQATAYFSDWMDLPSRSRSIFTQADGCGTDWSAMVAAHKAVSEALERWALYHTYERGDRIACGMDIDSTSCGMAAFPGLHTRQTRRFAMIEAVERYCLAEWACGRLPGRQVNCTEPGISVMELQNPVNRHAVVVIWRRLSSGDYAYGFSAGHTRDSAIFRAQIEMERWAVMMQCLPASHQHDPSDEIAVSEQRMLYFSKSLGHENFLEHVRRSTHFTITRHPPAPVVDSPVPGPWDRYAHVWRVLFPMPEEIYSPNPRVFYF